jgi:hypothetical protein
MMFFSVSSEIIALGALLIAIYGALLSTLIYLFDRRIRIKVTITPGSVRPKDRVFVVPNVEDFTIAAANLGTRETSLGMARLEFPRTPKAREMPLIGELPLVGQMIYDRNVPDPYEFAPGKPDLIIRANGKIIADSVRAGLLGWIMFGTLPFRASIAGVAEKRHRSKKMLLDALTGVVIDKPLLARLKWAYYILRGAPGKWWEGHRPAG